MNRPSPTTSPIAALVLATCSAPVTAPAQTLPPPPRVLAETTGDLDGDGVVETVRLSSDGRMRVYHGARERLDAYGSPAAALSPFEPDDYAQGTPALSVVDIDRGDRQRELMMLEAHGDEDPEGEFSFWVYREGRLWPMLRLVSTDARSVTLPHGRRPTIAGDGTVRAVYQRCVRDADPSGRRTGISERVAVRLVLTDGVLPRAELMENIATSRRSSHCIQAACPVVRVGEHERAVGEILRDLRGESMERWQPLRLPTSEVDPEGYLTVTLREERRELTRLDGVYLEADGRRVEPEGCEGGARPWCAADGARATLSPGQSLRLRFRVGGARRLTLWAAGYYLPLDDAGEPR